MHVIPAVLLYINVLITACCSSAEVHSSPTASSWQRLFNVERNTDPPTGLSSARRVLEHIQTLTSLICQYLLIFKHRTENEIAKFQIEFLSTDYHWTNKIS